MAMLLMLLIFDLLGITDENSASAILISVIVLQIVVFVLPMVFYARLKEIKYTKDVMLRPFAFSRLGLVAALLGVMITGTFLINVLLSANSNGEGAAASEQYLAISANGGIFLTVMAVCVAPAVCEEFAFRGVLLAEYRKYRAFPACLATAILFAAVHLDLDSFVANVFCGLILAWLVIVTRSLLTSMLLHVLYNICVVFFIPYLWRVTLQPLGTLFIIFAFVAIFLICLAIALGEAQAIYAEYARSPFMENEAPDNKMGITQGLCRVLLSPSFLLCIIAFVIVSLVR